MGLNTVTAIGTPVLSRPVRGGNTVWHIFHLVVDVLCGPLQLHSSDVKKLPGLIMANGGIDDGL